MSDLIKYFRNGLAFRSWLEKNGSSATELWLGFYKVDSGKKGITYKEAVDEALCFGWIDGIRKTADELSYKIRFTPRKLSSGWSKVNVERVKELHQLGLMQPEGLRLYEARKDVEGYSIRERPNDFPPEYEKVFQKNAAAWQAFQKLPPSHRRQYIAWVTSAKQEETRQRRLDQVISRSVRPAGKL